MEAEIILNRLKERGLAGEMSDEEILPFIEEARIRLLGYCNIPIKAKMPEGLYEVWNAIAIRLLTDGELREVASVSEGDITVKFSDRDELFGLKAAADRYRRLHI